MTTYTNTQIEETVKDFPCLIIKVWEKENMKRLYVKRNAKAFGFIDLLTAEVVPEKNNFCYNRTQLEEVLLYLNNNSNN